MLSLRALSRAAPRALPRFASQTTRTSFTPLIRTALRSRQPQLPRAFSTTFTCLDDSSTELAAKLNQEIQLESEENHNPAESNEQISAFLTQNSHWTLTDDEGASDILLTRQYDDETITVSFSIVDFNTPMMESETDADEAFPDEEDEGAGLETGQSGGANTKGAINQGKTGGGNFKVAPEDSIAPADREELRNPEDADAEGEAQPAFPATVNVLVQRKAKGALRINLIAENGMFNIQNVTHLPDSASTSNKSASELIREPAETLYTGPPFQQLDEEVQSLLEQYLDVRGINTALALFVPEYIDVKEQKEYLGWLSRVKEFVE